MELKTNICSAVYTKSFLILDRVLHIFLSVLKQIFNNSELIVYIQLFRHHVEDFLRRQFPGKSFEKNWGCAASYILPYFHDLFDYMSRVSNYNNFVRSPYKTQRNVRRFNYKYQNALRHDVIRGKMY